MEAKVKAETDEQQLKQNLEKRFKDAEKTDEGLKVELDDPEKLEKVPGIREYTANGKTVEGLKGKPLEERAYARLETRRQVAEAFLATLNGYRLVVLGEPREWDLKMLKKYNPSIKQASKPLEALGIEKSVNVEGFEDVGPDLTEEDVDEAYDFLMS